jgi:amino acid permease
MSTKNDSPMEQTQPTLTKETDHLTGNLEIERSQPLLLKDVEDQSAVSELLTSCKTPDNFDQPQESFSWSQRTFGPMKPGSIRASIFSLVSTAMGTGILTLPYLLKISGFAVGVGLLATGALLSWLSLVMLSYASFKVREVDYYHVVQRVLGKNAAVIVSCLVAFYGFGASVGYQITIMQFIPPVVSAVMGFEFEPTNAQRLIIIMGIALVVFPIALIRNLYGLRYGTYFGMACVLYILFVVVWQTPQYFSENDSLSNIVYFKWNLNFFTSFAVAAFSYTCHSNLFPVRAELARPTLPRLQKVVGRAVGANVFLYITMAICGYLSLTENTPQLIISRPKLAGASSDWVNTFAQLAMTITLVISVIINLSPTRQELLTLAGKSRNVDTKIHVLLTAILVFSTAFFAYALPNVIAALGLIGGIGSVSFSITFPFLVYAKVKEQEIESGSTTTPRIVITLVRLVAGIFSIIGLIGAGVSFGEALHLI